MHQPLVLFLGRINWKKGLDRLIKAIPFVPDAHLVIAGNDEEDYLPELQRLVTENKLEGRVSFVPRNVSGANKEALYAAAKIFVLPSYSENFGNTVLEAMIRKLPVMVTEEVGAKEVVSKAKGGMVIAADDLAKSITSLLQDQKRMNEYASNGHYWVAKHMNWQVVAEGMEQCYRDILEGI